MPIDPRRRTQELIAWAEVARRQQRPGVPPNNVLGSLGHTWDGRPLGPQFGPYGAVLAHIMLACDAGHPAPVDAALDSIRRGVAPRYPVPGTASQGAPVRPGSAAPPPSVGASPTGPAGGPVPPPGQGGAPQPAVSAVPSRPATGGQGPGPGPTSPGERPSATVSAVPPPAVPPRTGAPAATEGPRERLAAWMSATRVSLSDGLVTQLLKVGGNEKAIAQRMPSALKSHAKDLADILGEDGQQAPGAQGAPIGPPPGGQGSPGAAGPGAAGPGSPAPGVPGPQGQPAAPLSGPPPMTLPPPQGQPVAPYGQSPYGQQPNLQAPPPYGHQPNVQGPPSTPVPEPEPPKPDTPGVIASLEDPDRLIAEVGTFAEMLFEEVDNPITPVPMRVAHNAGRLRLSWPPVKGHDDEVVLLRVVSGENEVPLSPDHAETVAVVTGEVAIDPRPLRSAVRHYQVWVNIGATDEEARWNQPQLYSSTQVVSGPWDLEIRPEGQRVIGKWAVAPGIKEVSITRVSLDALSPAAMQNPANRLQPGQDHLTGFVDSEVKPGPGYLYRVVAMAQVGDALLKSQPIDVKAMPEYPLEAVDDLEAEQEPGDATTFTLTWTPPRVGRVEIFRTRTRPEAPAGNLHPEVLPQVGLGEENRRIHPVGRTEDGKAVMVGVPSPDDWTRVYFTPVTFLDERAVVGATQAIVVPGRIRTAEVVERGGLQIITLGWPAGTSSVSVYVAPDTVPVDDAIKGTQALQMSEQLYRLQGGVLFKPGQLPATGCSVHLVPVSYDAEGAVSGQPYTVRYPGVYRVWYDVAGVGGMGAMFNRGIRHIRFQSSQTFPELEFVVAFKPDRIPLHVKDDCEILPVVPLAEEPQPPQRSIRTRIGPEASHPWVVDLGQRKGWLRVFAVGLTREQEEVFGLIDPDPSKLFTP